MLRELDQRSRDGLTVTLSWDDDEHVVILHLDDHGSTAVAPVAPDRALDAFWHPFVYLTPTPAAVEADDDAELVAV